jgi:holliday junction DNA helicase RuvB
MSQTSLDSTLRPKEWNDYVGQQSIKDQVSIVLEAAKFRGESPEHMLFYGPPGLGKTTLAHLISHEMNANIKITSGPAIEKVGDLASLLTNLSDGDVLFIDEIHRLSKLVEEILYPAMESGVLDIIVGKGPSARSIQLDLPKFTLLAATTRIGLLSSPLRSRFSGGTFRLEPYSLDEMASIGNRTAKLLEIEINQESMKCICIRARSTPRTLNGFLKRVRDFSQVKERNVDEVLVNEVFELLKIDSAGMNDLDRMYLHAIKNIYKGGPVGVKTLAATLNEDDGTLEDVVEPYLMQCGFLEKTPKGRLLTEKGFSLL